jgi:hypothetical protein
MIGRCGAIVGRENTSRKADRQGRHVRQASVYDQGVVMANGPAPARCAVLAVGGVGVLEDCGWG